MNIHKTPISRLFALLLSGLAITLNPTKAPAEWPSDNNDRTVLGNRITTIDYPQYHITNKGYREVIGQSGDTLQDTIDRVNRNQDREDFERYIDQQNKFYKELDDRFNRLDSYDYSNDE